MLIKYLSVAALCFFSVISSGCSEKQKQIVRVAHTQIEAHPDHQGLVAFKNYIEEHSDGRFDIQIFPNSTLGANEKVLELVKQGSVQFLVVSSANIEYFDRLYSIFSFPYLFTSKKAYEEFILNDDILKKLNVNSAKNGFESLAAFTAGIRNFYAKSPVYSVADLQGKKFRVQAGPINIAMMQAFGATAIPMSFGEVYSALQQGIIDGAENNELVLADQKHGDIAKFYTYDMHQMCPDYLIGSNRFLKTLSESDREIFDEAIKLAQKVEFDAWNDAVEKAKTAALKKNVTFIDVDVEEFREHVTDLHAQLIVAAPQLEELYKIADEFNSRF